MSTVVDSSAWIEWLAEGRLAPRLEKHLPRADLCVVPTMVQLEVYKWLLRERDERQADAFVAYTRECIVVDLRTSIALHAADICLRHKLPTADAIIYATAHDQGADLLTCDAHFEGFDNVVYLRKDAD